MNGAVIQLKEARRDDREENFTKFELLFDGGDVQINTSISIPGTQ